MNTAAEFRRHAEECLRMAGTAANIEEKSSWRRFADRWLRCAEQADKEDAAARAMASDRKVRHRQSRGVWERSDHAA
jgi:hypothetical protein